ncbi:unnamed protein product [Lota lota]
MGPHPTSWDLTTIDPHRALLRAAHARPCLSAPGSDVSCLAELEACSRTCNGMAVRNTAIWRGKPAHEQTPHGPRGNVNTERITRY